MAENHDFSIGDTVQWASVGNGVKKEKTGEIVSIVPAHVELWLFLHDHKELRQFLYSSLNGGDSVRNEVSYLVAVAVTTKTGRPSKFRALYWPRVKMLRKIGHDGIC